MACYFPLLNPYKVSRACSGSAYTPSLETVRSTDYKLTHIENGKSRNQYKFTK